MHRVCIVLIVQINVSFSNYKTVIVIVTPLHADFTENMF